MAFTRDGVAGRAPQETTTDEGGWFTLPPPRPPVPGRRLVLAAEQDGLRAAIVIRPGSAPPDPLRLLLVADTTVSGHVRDADAEPVTGAQVRLIPTRNTVRKGRTYEPHDARRALANETGFSQWATATAPDGRWRVEGVPPGEYLVQVHAGRHQTWMPDPVQVAADDAHVDAGTVQVTHRVSLFGTVRSPDGAPQAGALVIVSGDAQLGQRASVLTHDDGTYEVTDLPPGLVQVSARLGLSTSAPTSVTLADRPEEIDFTLTPQASVDLRVRDTHGTPWQGIAQVRARAPGRPRAALPPVTLAFEHGAARWPEAPPGPQLIEAWLGGARAASVQAVDLRAGATTTVALTAEAGAQLTGTVTTAGGDPSPGAEVHLRHDDGQRHLATTDARGRFVFSRIAPATYTVFVAGPGGAPQEAQWTIGGGATTQDITLRPSGRVRVRVHDGDGRPVRNAHLVFRTANGLIRGVRPALTDPEGRALQAGLPLGQVIVHARTADGRSGIGEVEVRTRGTAVVGVTVK